MQALLREIATFLDSVMPNYPNGIPVVSAKKGRVIAVVHADEVRLENGAWQGPHAEFLKKVCEKGVGVSLQEVELVVLPKGHEFELTMLPLGATREWKIISFGVIPPFDLAESVTHGAIFRIKEIPFLLTLPLTQAETAEGKRLLWQELKSFLAKPM